MSFLREIKRRKVFQVAAVYAVVVELTAAFGRWGAIKEIQDERSAMPW